ncbi:MAG TPA: hypothetical protein VGM90_09855 [Kofleriaceae bacterium]|jgi:hypothetical protein
MANVDDIINDMRGGSEIHFNDLAKVCEHYFGIPRSTGTSHNVYKTPWPLDPRVNIQNDKGKAKPYQVRQVLAAIDKLAQIKAEPAAKAAAEKGPVKPEPKSGRKSPKKR